MKPTVDLSYDRVERLGPGRTLDALVAEVFTNWRPDPLDPVPAPSFSTRADLTDAVLAKVRAACGDDLRLDETDVRGTTRCTLTRVADGDAVWQTTALQRNVAVLRVCLHFAHGFGDRLSD